jgi:hypothetical protein
MLIEPLRVPDPLDKMMSPPRSDIDSEDETRTEPPRPVDAPPTILTEPENPSMESPDFNNKLPDRPSEASPLSILISPEFIDEVAD